MQTLIAITPIDGRYYDKTRKLLSYFSEYAIMKYRIDIELKYFKYLTTFIPQLIEYNQNHQLYDPKLHLINELFDTFQACKVKNIEHDTNHDVKAIEYYLRQKFDKYELSQFKEFIHFGLTSQDVNSVMYTQQLYDVTENIKPLFKNLMDKLFCFYENSKDVKLLSHTHGQPATPTTLGKEFYVFYERLDRHLVKLEDFEFSTKFGGAVGTLQAHKAAYPNIDWENKMDEFISEGFGFKRNQFTKQIDHYDNHAELFDIYRRINTILIDMCQDIWLYISKGYFKLLINEGEVGSSTMPHKVNPINFENAEGNFGLSNNMFDYFSNKLPVSRLQRDLTDSTVLRNLGVAFGYTYIGLHSLLKGLDKLDVNFERIKHDLSKNQVVMAESIQMILRKHGYPDAYNKLKEFTQGKNEITSVDFFDFIMALDVDNKIQLELLALF